MAMPWLLWLLWLVDMVRMGEETPMDCDEEWDIRNEFVTVDGMPVYYGGDLCDSD